MLSSASPSEVRPGSENAARDPFQGALQVGQRLAARLVSVGRATRTRADADTLLPRENLGTVPGRSPSPRASPRANRDPNECLPGCLRTAPDWRTPVYRQKLRELKSRLRQARQVRAWPAQGQ